MKAEVLSLQSVCLKTIVKNFSKFSTAYSFSQDARLQKQLEFLQRMYTFEIMLKLSKISELKDEYLSILMNKYLKKLDLKLLLNCTSEAILEHVSKIGEGLIEVTCDGNLPSDLSADIFVRHLPNVKILNLPNDCTDDTLQIIAKYCSNLTELYVYNSFKLTGKGYRSLCHQNESGMQVSLLKVLYLDDTLVQDNDIAFLLENLPFLEIVNYKNVPLVLYAMHRKELECETLHKARKYRLTELYFIKCGLEMSPMLTVCSELCPHVKKIHLQVALPEHLILCSKFISLQSLTVEGEILGWDTYIDINNFITLKGNSIHNFIITDFTLSASVLVQKCPNIEVLRLKNVAFHPVCNARSTSMKCFREFTLEEAAFLDYETTASVNLILTSSPNLESISFSFCKFRDSEFPEKLLNYCKGSMLKHIYFGFCDVELSFMESILLSCRSLQSLKISFCYGVEDISSLQEISSNLKNAPVIIYHPHISEFSEDNSDSTDISDGSLAIFDDFYSGFVRDMEIVESHVPDIGFFL